MPIETVTLPDGACVEGPCSWPVLLCESTDDDDSCYAGKLDDLDAETRQLVLQAAVSQLWNCSGRRYGTCEQVVRPVRVEECQDYLYSSPPFGSYWSPYLDGGRWYNRRAGCQSDCGEACEVLLPGGQVCNVSEVLLDGVPLSAEQYRVDNRRRLVRTAWRRDTFGDFRFAGLSNRVSATGAVEGDSLDVGLDNPTPGQTYAAVPFTLSTPVGMSFGRNRTAPRATFTLDANSTLTTAQPWTVVHQTVPLASSSATSISSSLPTVVTVEWPTAIGPTTIVLTLTAGSGAVDAMSYLTEDDSVCWPTCQDLRRAPTQEGTFQVTYTKGNAVPAGGQIAAGVLAVELARACLGDPGCRLPQRVTSISRQGVSMALLDPDVGTDCRTGLYQVDAWLDSVTNPHRRFGSAVINPQGLGRHRRTTSNG